MRRERVVLITLNTKCQRQKRTGTAVSAQKKGRCQLGIPQVDSRLPRGRMDHTPVQCHRDGGAEHLLWDTHSVWQGRLQ